MNHKKLAAVAFTVVLSALMLPTTRAEDFADPFGEELQTPPETRHAVAESDQTFETPALQISAPTPARPAVLKQAPTYYGGPQPIDAGAGAVYPTEAPQQPGYVHLGAPMYPTPRPNIPIWSGSTMITNQAFAPHEMLYPHSYRAIYPPYYHRVKGGWVLTPFGVRSHERWELQGTQVQVNYRSSHPGLLKGKWHPPATSTYGGVWR